jgi:hypothetical protein
MSVRTQRTFRGDRGADRGATRGQRCQGQTCQGQRCHTNRRREGRRPPLGRQSGKLSPLSCSSESREQPGCDRRGSFRRRTRRRPGVRAHLTWHPVRVTPTSARHPSGHLGSTGIWASPSPGTGTERRTRRPDTPLPLRCPGSQRQLRSVSSATHGARSTRSSGTYSSPGPTRLGGPRSQRRVLNGVCFQYRRTVPVLEPAVRGRATCEGGKYQVDGKSYLRVFESSWGQRYE